MFTLLHVARMMPLIATRCYHGYSKNPARILKRASKMLPITPRLFPIVPRLRPIVLRIATVSVRITMMALRIAKRNDDGAANSDGKKRKSPRSTRLYKINVFWH